MMMLVDFTYSHRSSSLEIFKFDVSQIYEFRWNILSNLFTVYTAYSTSIPEVTK